MIRRAQAEALLKLAEALEECERNDLSLWATPNGDQVITAGYTTHRLESRWLDTTSVRMTIAKLYPKSE